MRKKKSNLGVILTMLIAVALVGGLAGYQYMTRMHEEQHVEEVTLENATPKVSVVYPGKGPESEELTLPGTIDAWYQAPIYAQVSGYVKMWHKDFGAEVKEGDLLAEINTPALDAEYEKAKAELRSAEAEYKLASVTAKRWRAMRDSQAVSEQAISEKEAHEKSLSALVDSAKQNVQRYVALQKFKQIVAPFDGIVISRSINVGDYVSEGGGLSASGEATELFSVADTHKMRLFVSVPEVFATVLKPGLTAEVVVPQFQDRRYTANFLTVAKGFDRETRTTVTEFTIDNDDASLWPGSYATVEMTAPANTEILTIPTSSLVFMEDGLQVATVTDDNHVHYKSVKSGKILGEIVQILLGVTAQDRIINNPTAALMEGEKVSIVEPTPGYNLTKHHNEPMTAENGHHSESESEHHETH